MWHVYIVECADGSYYTGITNNIERRIDEHNEGSSISAKYTRYRRPVKLVYIEDIASRSEATKRETKIKNLSRKEKELLIGRVAQW